DGGDVADGAAGDRAARVHQHPLAASEDVQQMLHNATGLKDSRIALLAAPSPVAASDESANDTERSEPMRACSTDSGLPYCRAARSRQTPRSEFGGSAKP